MATAREMSGVVYGLKDPRDGKYRYVGQTTDEYQRKNSHRMNLYQGNYKKSQWQHELTMLRMEPVFVVLERCEWHRLIERERHWIQCLSAEGHELVNCAVGAIARADLVTGEKWCWLHEAAALIQDHIQELSAELWKCCPVSSRESKAIKKASDAIRSLRCRLEDRFVESMERKRG